MRYSSLKEKSNTFAKRIIPPMVGIVLCVVMAFFYWHYVIPMWLDIY